MLNKFNAGSKKSQLSKEWPSSKLLKKSSTTRKLSVKRIATSRTLELMKRKKISSMFLIKQWEIRRLIEIFIRGIAKDARGKVFGAKKEFAGNNLREFRLHHWQALKLWDGENPSITSITWPNHWTELVFAGEPSMITPTLEKLNHTHLTDNWHFFGSSKKK